MEGSIHTLSFNSFIDITRKHEATIRTLVETNQLQTSMIESLEAIIKQPNAKAKDQVTQTGSTVKTVETQTHDAIISTSTHIHQVMVYEKGIKKLEEKNAALELRLKQRDQTMETMKKVAQEHDAKMRELNKHLMQRNATLRADFKKLSSELKKLKREFYRQEEMETAVIHITDSSSSTDDDDDDDNRTTPSVASK